MNEKQSEDPSQTLLVKRDICRWNDKDINPYEMLVVNCNHCREFDDGRRTTLQDRGWRTAFHPDFVEGEHFMLCPKCSQADYTWEDLY